MSRPEPQPASPPTFHLRICLKDLSGGSEPFLGRDYEIEWGGKRVVWDEKVPPDGVITAEFEHRGGEGVLSLGTTDGVAFLPLLRIPLREVPDPPPQREFSPWELGAVLQRAADYESAWRLSNLGHLPGLRHLTYPISGDVSVRLRNAALRYAHKRGLDVVTDPDMDPLAERDVATILKEEHDGR